MGLTSAQLNAVLAIGVIGGLVLLVRQGGKVLDAVGDTATTAGRVIGAPLGFGVGTIADLADTIGPNQDRLGTAGDAFSLGEAAFKLRVALFGLPADFPASARARNPGLIGQVLAGGGTTRE